MSKLVIAEKPMLARDIACAITGKEVSRAPAFPISGNGYTVCACAGHLSELVKPDAIDPKSGMPWSLDVLPIEVHDWPKEPAVDKKTEKSKKPLIDQIAGLLETCDSVIAAVDPDDEGQLIVDELLDYLGHAGKVERVYVNDNREEHREGIRQARAQRLLPGRWQRRLCPTDGGYVLRRERDETRHRIVSTACSPSDACRPRRWGLW